MRRIIIPFFMSVLILTSCTETKPIVREKQIRTTEATAAIITEPMVLEIDSLSSQPLIDSSVFNISSFENAEQLNSAIPSFKQTALEIFIFKSDFDMIVNPTYHVYTRDSKEKRTYPSASSYDGKGVYYQSNIELVVVVQGYGVKYKQLRKATPDDVWMSYFGGHK